MKRRAAILTATMALVVGATGVTASALLDRPQDATPARDPIADLLRQTPSTPPPEAAPAGTPAPANPVPVTPPGGAEAVALAAAQSDAEAAEDEKDEEETRAEPASRVTEPDKPAPRQRRRIAIVQAVDKITAETMRFEVEVGGRPVRFNQSLIFTARACEVSPPEDRAPEAAAYLEVTLQPRGTARPAEARQIFRGWMFASSPGINGLEHPIYDAWVVGCRA